MRVEPERLARQPTKTKGKKRSGRGWRLWIHALRYIRACIFLVNIRTLAMAAFACMMVYLCQTERFNLRFRMEFNIISIGTVFPLVFSIQQAFNRREEALRDLSVLKGVLMGLYFCHRDWDVSDGVTVRSNLGNDESPHAARCAALIHELLTQLRCWLCGRTPYESESEWRLLYGTTDIVRELTHHLSGDFFRGFEEDLAAWDSDSSDSSDSSSDGDGNGNGGAERRRLRKEESAQAFAERDPHWKLYYKLYDTVSKISVLNEQLMVLGMCSKAGEAGFSRLAAYLAKTVEVLERLRCIRENRTPFMLRYVSFVLVIVTIVLAAPYFAFMCVQSRWEDDTTGNCPAGYFTAVLYVLVLSTLFHVQVALENPFDGIGVDDVFVNLDREFAVTVRRYVRSRAEATKKAAAAAVAAAAAAAAAAELTATEKVLVEELKPGMYGSFGGGSGGGGGATAGGGSGGATTAFRIVVEGQSKSSRAAAAAVDASQRPPSKGADVGVAVGAPWLPSPLRSAGRAPYTATTGPYRRTSGDASTVWEREVDIPGAGQQQQ
ncbi:hypothetical protein PLESTB_000709100 [Pleodorina starrii]|uniref:Uncharacterized protein n=1 Tax=Pleodorina starrii TaxID=330485 RepID=A0A9W6BA69_9CHLO|nr:hypothetical protein PLESTB_000053400 [Pleodorina starrii]GLC53113.1 hypothetical protein PLESTB_000709100 [Pleodorina starrii]GLC69265.1 hypothetical protein PLESTF_000808600 [Pleodorina starrii]